MKVPAFSEEMTIQLGGGLFIAMGVAGSFLFASQAGFAFFSVASCALAIAGAAFLVGCLTGFLFGIPRAPSDSLVQPEGDNVTAGANAGTVGGDRVTKAAAGSEAVAGTSIGRYRPNTNLEQISDWLTKILVGVGLTQLAQVPQAASALAQGFSPLLGGEPQSGGFGVAMTIYFFVGGFIVTYLWTRLKLGVAFGVADDPGIRRRLRVLEEEFTRATAH
jgi:hypothetical protein